MSADGTDSEPAPLETRFGASLRIDEQWFKALHGELGDETDS